MGRSTGSDASALGPDGAVWCIISSRMSPRRRGSTPFTEIYTMAIAKARSSLPVRGYYVTPINPGRVIQQSGSGFGLPRLGGLLNAQVEGLTGGSSATGR